MAHCPCGKPSSTPCMMYTDAAPPRRAIPPPLLSADAELLAGCRHVIPGPRGSKGGLGAAKWERSHRWLLHWGGVRCAASWTWSERSARVGHGRDQPCPVVTASSPTTLDEDL